MTIRIATKDDVPDLAHIHVEGWKAAYGGIIDADYIANKDIELRKRQWAEWFEEDKVKTLIGFSNDENAAGFISFGTLKTPPPGMSPIRPLYSSEIYAFYILPDYWRQGLGTKLMRDAVQSLEKDKHKSVCLWVLEKNKGACEFYKAMGGERCGKINVEFGPTKAKEICYGWRDTKKVLEK